MGYVIFRFLLSWAILNLAWTKYVNNLQVATVSHNGKHGIYFLT